MEKVKKEEEVKKEEVIAKEEAPKIPPDLREKIDSDDDVIEKRVDDFGSAFSDITEITFFKSREDKVMGRLPTGKLVFPNRDQKIEDIEIGIPYLVALKHLEKVAFAKILSIAFLPRIIFNHDRAISVIKETNKRSERRIHRDINEAINFLHERKIERFMFIDHTIKISDDKKHH
jgi:hypothetical protein